MVRSRGVLARLVTAIGPALPSCWVCMTSGSDDDDDGDEKRKNA
jgi:hypothetical protein